MNSQPTIYQGAAVRDAAGCMARPGAVAVAKGRIAAVGSPADVQRQVPGARLVQLPGQLILPAMVNAHAHLDLSPIGPVAFTGDFLDWVRQVMQYRMAMPVSPARAVEQGVALLRQGGVGWVGDIAGSGEAAGRLAKLCQTSSMQAVSYLECFGHGRRWQAAVDQVTAVMDQWGCRQAVTGSDTHSDDAACWRLGIQPHAPYSAGRDLYQAAIQLARQFGLPLATHLAEHDEEAAFVRSAAGPFADQLKAWGKWDPAIQPTGLHPIDWMTPMLHAFSGSTDAHRPTVGWLLAHCNQVEDAHLELLAKTGATVVYCPIASDYFGHRNHRYRDLLAAGVNVALGSDSILCQSPNDPQPLSILSQMRHLYQRDRTDPGLLLAMATTRGLKALGLEQRLATLTPHVPARLTAVAIDPDDATDPLVQALSSRQPIRPVTGF